MDELINVDGLVKRYEGFSLEDVSLSVPAGTVVGLIGSNGAGKTTLIKAILGLITPDGGSISLFGCDPRRMDKEIDSIKRRIGVVLDTCAFLTTMRVRDVAGLGRAAYPTWDGNMFSSYCESFGLDAKKQVKDLSRGMGMKLTLAFALSHQPELLILDEATAGLDPMARDEMLDILREFMNDEGHAILMATHITTDLEKIADEVACIDSGRIVFEMPKEAICDEAGIAHCRRADIEHIAACGLANIGKDPDANDAFVGYRLMQRGLGTDLLVPDRFAFSEAFPEIAVERASIEDYMAFALRGETLKGEAL